MTAVDDSKVGAPLVSKQFKIQLNRGSATTAEPLRIVLRKNNQSCMSHDDGDEGTGETELRRLGGSRY
jgi:hypothetical protein